MHFYKELFKSINGSTHKRNVCEDCETAKCQRQRMLSRNEGALLKRWKISGKRDKIKVSVENLSCFLCFIRFS
jgi:hypothetical protein